MKIKPIRWKSSGIRADVDGKIGDSTLFWYHQVSNGEYCLHSYLPIASQLGLPTPEACEAKAVQLLEEFISRLVEVEE